MDFYIYLIAGITILTQAITLRKHVLHTTALSNRLVYVCKYRDIVEKHIRAITKNNLKKQKLIDTELDELAKKHGFKRIGNLSQPVETLP